ncbi:putative cytochrome P450 [Streptomyces sp. Tu6071]|nr:putative cytochrome P450 [Streptomyces sp. Tu6071]
MSEKFLGLQPGETGTQAVVRAAPEGEVAAPAQRVEGVRVGVAARIVRGGPVHHVDRRVARDRDPGEDEVLRGDAGVDRDGRVPAQRLLDRRRDVLRVRGQPGGAGRVGGGEVDRVAQQDRARLQGGDGDEHGEVIDDLVGGGPVAGGQGVEVCDPLGEGVVAGPRAALADEPGEELPHLQRGLLGDGELRSGGQQLLRVDLAVGEIEEVGVVGAVDADPLADRERRQLLAHDPHEVGVPLGPDLGLQFVEERGDERGDHRAQGFERGTVERGADRAALAGVRRGVEPGEGTGHLAGREVAPALGVVLALLPVEVGTPPFPAAQHLVAGVEADDEVAAPGCGDDVAEFVEGGPHGARVRRSLSAAEPAQQGDDGTAADGGGAGVMAYGVHA